MAKPKQSKIKSISRQYNPSFSDFCLAVLIICMFIIAPIITIVLGLGFFLGHLFSKEW